jgi:hypothetical protein
MRTLLNYARELLVRNWWLKFAGLLLAYILWLLVRSGEGERIITVPLVVQIPRNMEIVSERPATVEASVLGVPNLAGNMPNMAYAINLQAAGEGELTVPLTPQGIRTSPGSGITVVRVSPARLTFLLERVVSKDVPVKVPLLGVTAEGFDLYKVTCQPDIVHIIGPRSDINPLKEVATDPLSIAGRKRSFQQTVNFNLQGDDIHISPVTVEVDVQIGVHRAGRTFRIPVVVLGEEGLAASPPFVSVSLLVPVTFKGRLAAEDLTATASVPSDKPLPNRVVVKPEVKFRKDLEADIVIKQVNPEVVTLLHKTGKK